MASWPTSLPQVPLADGFEEQAVDITLRSSVDVGPEKTRPLYTAEPVDVTCPLLLTTAQVSALETFYKTSLNFGNDTFTWQNPRTAAAATLKFRSRPGYRPLSGSYWQTTLELRIWP